MKSCSAGNNRIWVCLIHIHSGLWRRRGTGLTSCHLAIIFYTCHLLFLSFIDFTVISLLYCCEESLRVQWHIDLTVLLLNYYCSQIMIHQWHQIRSWMTQGHPHCEAEPSKREIDEAIKQLKNGKSEEPDRVIVEVGGRDSLGFNYIHSLLSMICVQRPADFMPVF